MPSRRLTRSMPPTIAICRAFFSPMNAACMLLAASASAQVLPPTAPTTVPAPAPAPTPQSVAAATPATRAQVQFSNGLLSISTSGNSLNQILRDISSLTGMTITGGVTDERVFGTYGPADTGVVLTYLLNGTGSNMVLRENRDRSPRELVLTPRQGGPTPPSPNTYRDPEPPREFRPQQQPPQQQPPQMPPQQMPPQGPPQQQPPQMPAPPTDTSQTQTQSQTQTTTPDSSTTTQQSPNGVKTPQQIYEELMKLQQQQPTTPH